MSKQRGFAHILLILILLVGLGVGVYLVQQRTNFFPKASSDIDSLTTQLLEKNSRYASRSAQDVNSAQNLVADMTAVASERQNLLLQELDESPQAFLDHARLFTQRENFPHEIQQYLEEKKEVSGTSLLVHGDNFENLESKYFYNIVSDDDTLTTVHFVGVNQNFISNGQPVTASGVSMKSELVLPSAQNLTTNSAGRNAQNATKSPSGPQRLVVLSVSLGSQSLPPVSAVRSQLFSSSGSLNAYYQENSNGILSINGDIYEISLNFSPNECSWDTVWSLAVQSDREARNRGIPIESYPRILYLFPGIPNCSTDGYGSVGEEYPRDAWNPSRSWILNPNALRQAAAHEFGHNLGLSHANSLKCGSSSVAGYDSCQNMEYDDPSDIMAYKIYNGLLPYFNAPHKASLGWVSQSNIQDARSTGAYLINLPLETIGLGTSIIRIPKIDSNEFYYLSYRQPIGEDAGLPETLTQGVSIHIWDGQNPNLARQIQTKLVDTTPDSPLGMLDAPLTDGQSLVDSANSISIKQLSHTDTSVSLEISLDEKQSSGPQVQRQLPTEVQDPQPTRSAGESTKSLYRFIYNKDGSFAQYKCPLDSTKPMGAELEVSRCLKLDSGKRDNKLQYSSEYVINSQLFRLMYYSDGSYKEQRCELDILLKHDTQSRCNIVRSLNIGTNLQYSTEYIAKYQGSDYLFRQIFNKDGTYLSQRCPLDETTQMGVKFNACTSVKSGKFGTTLQYTSEYVASYQGNEHLFRLVINKDGGYAEYRCQLDQTDPMGAITDTTKCTLIRSLGIGTGLQHTSEYVAP